MTLFIFEINALQLLMMTRKNNRVIPLRFFLSSQIWVVLNALVLAKLLIFLVFDLLTIHLQNVIVLGRIVFENMFRLGVQRICLFSFRCIKQRFTHSFFVQHLSELVTSTLYGALAFKRWVSIFLDFDTGRLICSVLNRWIGDYGGLSIGARTFLGWISSYLFCSLRDKVGFTVSLPNAFQVMILPLSGSFPYLWKLWQTDAIFSMR